MRIAVTGATGFLGRYVVERLLQAGHHLRCWYRPQSDREGFTTPQAIEWLPGRLNDPSATEALVRDREAVVHAALERGSAGFRAAGQNNFLAFIEANLMGSLRLFQAARTAGVRRFVFIATCAVHEVI